MPASSPEALDRDMARCPPAMLAQPFRGEGGGHVLQHLRIAAEHELRALGRDRAARGFQPAVLDRGRDPSLQRAGRRLAAHEPDNLELVGKLRLDLSNELVIDPLVWVAHAMDED